jgi:PRTRC genetic system protein A
LDIALQSLCPVLPAPKFSPLEPLAAAGHRMVLAANGLFVEIERPWMHAVLKVGEVGVPVPYGEMSEAVDLRFSDEQFRGMAGEFLAVARQAHPVEHAAWCEFRGSGLAYREVEVLASSSASIQYARPEPVTGGSLAIDLHSHGSFPAFWSATDDADDVMDDVKLGVVFGNLDRDRVSVASRLSAFGQFRDLTEWAVGVLAGTAVEAG